MGVEDYSLNLDTTSYQQSMASATGTTMQFQQALGGLTTNAGLAGRSIALVSAPVRMLERGLGGFSTQAQEAENRLAGLRATAVVTHQSVSQLAKEANNLARAFPVSAAAATALVGQLQGLGVAGVGSEKRIGALAKTMINLAGATGSSVGVITSQMAQVSRAFGDTNLDPRRITKFSDSLTTLTGKFGGNASGILEFTARIAPFARQAGIGEGATLGIAAAFAKLGDQGSSAATAVNKVLSDINKSVRDGGPQILTYANIVGKTAAQFQALVKTNPAQALTDVVGALGRGQAGQQALDRLGFADSVRTQGALASLSQGGQLSSAIQTSLSSQGSGATEAAAKQAYAGLTASLERLHSSGTQVAEVLGRPVLGGLTAFANALRGVTGMFAAVANTGIVQTLTGIGGVLGTAWLGYKLIKRVGDTTAIAKLAATSQPMRAYAAGNQLGRFGGNFDEAYAAGTERQRHALTMYQRLQEGESTGPMSTIARGVGSYASQRQAAVTAAIADRQQEMFDRRLATYGPDVGGRMNEATLSRAAATEAQGLGRGRRAWNVMRTPLAQSFQLYGQAASQMTQMANEPDNFKRNAINTPTGELAAPWRAFKDAAMGQGGLPRGADEIGERMRGMGRVIGDTSSALRAATTDGRAVSEIGRGMFKPLGANLKLIGSTLAEGSHSVLSSVGKTFGAGNLLLMGGTAAFAGVMAYRSSQQSAYASQSEHYRNMSITGNIDDYRDAIGKAGVNTITLADQLDLAGKAISRTVTTIEDARKVTSSDIGAAAERKKQLHSYTGTDSQIATQVGGLNLAGLDPAELQSIKLDLVKQFGAGRAGSILAKINTTGSGNTSGAPLTGDQAGTGTISQDLINANIDAAGRYQNTHGRGDGRNILASGLHGASFGTPLALFDAPNLQKPVQARLDSVVQALGQNYDTQKTVYSPEYAAQERVRGANAIMAEALKTARGYKGNRANVQARDLIRGTSEALSSSMGQGDHYFNPSDFDHGKSFTDVLSQHDKGFARTQTDLASRAPGYSPTGAGLTPTSLLNANAMLSMGTGAYGLPFDNTRHSAANDAVNASLTKPDDASKVEAAVNLVIKGARDAGESLAQIAGKAADYAGAIGDATAPLYQMQLQVRNQALQTNAFNAPFQSSGQTLATAASIAQGDLQNTGTDTGSVERRAQGKKDFAADMGALADQYKARIAQNRQFNVSLGRADYDFHLQVANQGADFTKSLDRQETDRNTSRFRAHRDYTISVQRNDAAFHLSLVRTQRDFGITLKRGAEDAAKSMYDPYRRVAVEAVWDGQSLLVNMRDQQNRLLTQQRELAKARKEGLSNAAIQQLGLADANHQQQLTELLQNRDNGDPNLFNQLNAATGARTRAAGALNNDPGNVSTARAKQDLAKTLADQRQDYRRSAGYSRADFQRSLADQDSDYRRNIARAQRDFSTAQERETQQFKLSRERMAQDLKNSQQEIVGDLASLQKLANKGLSASQGDFNKVLVDGVKTTLAALKKLIPDYQATWDKLQLGNTGTNPGAPTSNGDRPTRIPGTNLHIGGPAGTSSYTSPAGSAPVTSGYGPRESPGGIGSTYHYGIDYGVPMGTIIRAAFDGVVKAEVGENASNGLGNFVELDHGGGRTTRYGHLSGFDVPVGARVRTGQDIARSGSTGHSTGPHLHFETLQNGRALDPRVEVPLWSHNQTNANAQAGPPQLPRLHVPKADGSGKTDMLIRLFEAANRRLDAIESGKGLPGQAAGQTATRGGGGMATAPSGTGNVALGRRMATAYGWDKGTEWNNLYALWMQESGWSTTAGNPRSGAYGIPQAYSANGMNPMRSAGADWVTNPATQIAWGLGYIKDRYGDPIGAQAHKAATDSNQGSHAQYAQPGGWYGAGGIIGRPKVIGIGEHGPEAVIPLNEAGVAVLAAAMSRYMTNSTQQMMTTSSARTHVHYSNDTFTYDHSTKILGEVTVVSADPNEMGAKLAAKQRSANLTATATRRHA